ncbi:MAG: AMP-binding protein, partial [Proteobacteria bacterium]|nr:AMP-binding protein [Pseudomonadota bacterium]
MNITEPFRRLARLVPDQPAIIRADGSVISYRALDSAIDAMGRHASRFGIGAGDTVQVRVIGPDESLGLILLLAMARLGAVTTDTPVPGRRTRLTFHAGPGAPPATVTVDAGWMAGPPADPAASPPMPMDGAAVLRIFASSGSTGLPKQIVITHGQMTQRVLLRWLSQGGGPTTRIIGINPGGSWGLSVALASLWARGTVVLSNPADAPAAIARHHVDSLILTPASLRTMLDAMPPDLGPFPSLRAVEVGGSLLPPALLHLARERLTPHIQSAMGATEVGAFVTAPAIDLADRPGAVGLIWPGVEVQALDPDGQALPAGTAGVLRVRSPGNASGYAAADAAREDWFKDGWFYSSDIGTVWPDGMLTLSGRT